MAMTPDREGPVMPYECACGHQAGSDDAMTGHILETLSLPRAEHHLVRSPAWEQDPEDPAREQ